MLYGKTDMLLWGQASVLQPPVSGKRYPRQLQHEAAAGRFFVFACSRPEASMRTAIDGGSSSPHLCTCASKTVSATRLSSCKNIAACSRPCTSTALPTKQAQQGTSSGCMRNLIAKANRDWVGESAERCLLLSGARFRISAIVFDFQ